MAESLRFDIFAIDRASRTMDKIGEHSERMGGKLGKVGKVAAIGFSAVAAGVGAVALVMGEGLKQAADYQKLTAQTGAVLKSTGEKAGVSAEHVKALAESVSGYSGQTREAITGGENLLLTFTNIQNKAGKGNKIFDQATVALANMTQALGEDPKQAAIQLGKALNDPVKGITALRRVGVSFSADQIKVVKHLVATGHTMKAQKLILKELNSEFGGSAKAAGSTFGGAMDKLKNSLTDVLVNAMTPLLGPLTQFAGYLSEQIPKAVAFVSAKFKSLTGGAGGLSAAFKGLIGWVEGHLLPAFEHYYKQVGPAAATAFKDLGQALKTASPFFKTLGTILTDVILPISGQVAKVVLTVLGPAFKVVAAILNKIAVPALKLMVRIWLDMVGAIVNGLADAFGWIPGLGPKLKKAASDFNTFRNKVNNSLNGIKPFVTISFQAKMDGGLRAIMKMVGGQKGAALAQSWHGTLGAANSAEGQTDFRGGLSWVGEQGPELVAFPPHTKIYPHSKSMQMAGGGGTTVNIYVTHHGVSTPADDLRLGKTIVKALQSVGHATGPLQIKVRPT